jgi:hypothetical protein
MTFRLVCSMVLMVIFSSSFSQSQRTVDLAMKYDLEVSDDSLETRIRKRYQEEFDKAMSNFGSIDNFANVYRQGMKSTISYCDSLINREQSNGKLFFSRAFIKYEMYDDKVDSEDTVHMYDIHSDCDKALELGYKSSELWYLKFKTNIKKLRKWMGSALDDEMDPRFRFYKSAIRYIEQAVAGNRYNDKYLFGQSFIYFYKLRGILVNSEWNGKHPKKDYKFPESFMLKIVTENTLDEVGNRPGAYLCFLMSDYYASYEEDTVLSIKYMSKGIDKLNKLKDTFVLNIAGYERSLLKYLVADYRGAISDLNQIIARKNSVNIKYYFLRGMS